MPIKNTPEIDAALKRRKREWEMLKGYLPGVEAGIMVCAYCKSHCGTFSHGVFICHNPECVSNRELTLWERVKDWFLEFFKGSIRVDPD